LHTKKKIQDQAWDKTETSAAESAGKSELCGTGQVTESPFHA